MKRSESNIDELFRDQLFEYEASPDPTVWNNISQEMSLSQISTKGRFIKDLKSLLTRFGISSSLIFGPILITLISAGDSAVHLNFSDQNAMHTEEETVSESTRKMVASELNQKGKTSRLAEGNESSVPVGSTENGGAKVSGAVAGLTNESQGKISPPKTELMSADTPIDGKEVPGINPGEEFSSNGTTSIKSPLERSEHVANSKTQEQTNYLDLLELTKEQMLEKQEAIRIRTIVRQFGVEGSSSKFLGSCLEFPVFDRRYFNLPSISSDDSVGFEIMGGKKWALHALLTDDLFLGASLERFIYDRISLQTTWTFYNRADIIKNEYATLNVNYYFRPDGKNTFKALAGVGYSGRLVAEIGGAMFYQLSSRFNAFVEPRLNLGIETGQDTKLRAHFGVRWSF